MLRNIFYLAMLIIAAGFCSCSATRYVPSGEYLLNKNRIETDKETARQYRISADELEKYVFQKPNKRFLGTNFNLWVYTEPDSLRDNGWRRFWRKIGDAPVILDTNLVAQTADNLYRHMMQKGFVRAGVDYRITAKKKKATVTYSLHQNEPYRIGEIAYNFRDEFLRPVILQDTVNSRIRSGDPLDQYIMDAEILRITEYLRDRGYYFFNVNNIKIRIDTIDTAPYTGDLEIEINQFLSGYDRNNRPEYDNNRIYRIDRIFINPDYDPAAAASDPGYYSRMDTVEYRGLSILYSGEKPKVRKKVLHEAVNLYPNYLYNESEVQQAYSNIMRLGYYRNASIAFTDITDSTDVNLITFIGDEESETEESVIGETTTEGYMLCNINCIPALKQSYTIDLEGATSSNFYSVSATVGYQNRNLFRGAELFNASLKGTYEFMRAKGEKSAFEIGGATSMTFPRFITPFKIDPYNKAVNARTKFELSVSSQQRRYYHRTVSGMTWGYSWNNKGNSTFQLRPIDVNLVKVSYIDQVWLDSLENRYLANSFLSQLVAGISGSYIYNTDINSQFTNSRSLIFRLNVETAGNFFNGLTRLFSSPAYDADREINYYKIFGIRYAQYFRVDASVSQRLPVSPRSSFVYRFFIGGGMSYGNARYLSIPYDRLFYSGGSSSMRGWIARSLGAGSTPRPDNRLPYQTGNFKLEFNLESRFPVWGLMNGAVFFDVGNVWYLSKDDTDDPRGIFRFNRFYKQLGFNTGLGLRFDVNVAIIRLDWGIKLHDPNTSYGWVRSVRLKNTVLNFGVGYPF